MFDVGGDYHKLGQGNGVYFDLYGLDAAPKPAMITIQTPGGYGVSLVHRAQFVLGDAEVDTNRGVYHGEFEVAPRAAFDADPATAGCAEGTHAATWWMVLNGTHGELSVPVAVDRRGTGYALTVCLGSLRKLKLTASEVYFATRDVFRNPTKPGNYRFSAMVIALGRERQARPDDALRAARHAAASRGRATACGLRPGDEDADRHRHAARRRPARASASTFTSTAARPPTTAKQKELGYATTRTGGVYTLLAAPRGAAEVGVRLRLPLPLPDLLWRVVGARRLRQLLDRRRRDRRGAGEDRPLAGRLTAATSPAPAISAGEAAQAPSSRCVEGRVARSQRRRSAPGKPVNPSGAITLTLVLSPRTETLSLMSWRAAVVVDPAEEDAVGAGRLDLLEDRGVAGGLRVPGVVAEDLDAVLGGVVLEDLGHALAVGLVVVEDVALLHAEGLAGEDGGRRALDVVGGDDARVVALARRVVLVRLAGVPGRVRPTLVLACDTISSGPSGAWLRTGTSILAQPEFRVPMTATSSLVCTCFWALAWHCAWSHFAAAAVESSYFWSWIV